MADLGVIILTYNEERHIGRAIASVHSIARDIVIVDSGSKDRTVAIAQAAGARVLFHPFVNYAKQFKWALENAQMKTSWIMRLDADEVVERDLAEEIENNLDNLPAGVGGVNLKRKHIFMGRWIRHGGRYPLILLRVWRNGSAQIEQRWMDEHMLLSRGISVTFAGGFSDHNLNDLTYFIEKHNKYATREALDALISSRRLSTNTEIQLHQTSRQAYAKRVIKEKLYNSLPPFVGPLFYFLYRYIAQTGFLDGIEGLIYHALQGGWYRFLVVAKKIEIERRIAGTNDRKAILAEISKMTGYDL